MTSKTLLLAMIAWCVVQSGNAWADDLATVVARSLDHDPEIAMARAGYEAAKQAIPVARAGLLPQISGGWGRAYNGISVEGYPRQSYWQNGWTINLAQPVFDWSRWTTYRQADFVVARGAVEFEAARQATILRAVHAFFDELAAEDEVARSVDYAAAIDVQFDQIRRKRAAGEATVIDVREAEAAQAQAQLQQMAARSDLVIKRRAVEQLTGQPFSSLATLPPAVVMPRLEPENAEYWGAHAKLRAYDVQLKQLDLKSAKLDTAKARAAGYPVVYATASYTPAGAASGYSSPTTTTTGMLTISIPLFSGGEIRAHVKESEALEEKAQQGLVSATQHAEAAAQDSFTQFAFARSRAESLTHLVQTSHEALAATQVGYKVGSRTSADVLRAVDAFYASRRDLLQARYDAIVTLLQLESDVGMLSTDDIAQVNGVLAPVRD